MVNKIEESHRAFLGTHRTDMQSKGDVKGKSRADSSVSDRTSTIFEETMVSVENPLYKKPGKGLSEISSDRSFVMEMEMSQAARSRKEKIKKFVKGVFQRVADKLNHAKEVLKTKLQRSSNNGMEEVLVDEFSEEIPRFTEEEENFIGKLKGILEEAVKSCPEGASREVMQQAVSEALTKELYGEGEITPEKIKKENEKFDLLAKTDPEQAGRVLYLAFEKCPTSSIEDKDSVIRDIFSKFEDVAIRAEIVAGAMKAEIEDPTFKALPRQDKIGSRLMMQFVKEHVIPHFQASDDVSDALKKFPKKSVAQKDAYTLQKEIPKEAAQGLWRNINNLLDMLEDVLRNQEIEDLDYLFEILEDVENSVSDKFGEEKAESMHRYILIQRIINPFLNSLKEEGRVNRNIELTMKILEKMDRQETFDKSEPHLKVFNSFD